ncbi:MAG: hypothetical protein ACP6IU_15330, partial [Candidatus Asgardarchaeia archaeon]
DVNYRRADPYIYNEVMRQDKAEIIKLKNLFTNLVKQKIFNNKMGSLRDDITELNSLEEPKEIDLKINVIINKLRDSNVETDKEIFDIASKISNLIHLILIQEDHYKKHQSINATYFIDNYIILEPKKVPPDDRYINDAINDIKKEIERIKDIEDVKMILGDLEVIVYGDKTWEQKKLSLDDDARIWYNKKGEIPATKKRGTKQSVPEEDLEVELNAIDDSNKKIIYLNITAKEHIELLEITNIIPSTAKILELPPGIIKSGESLKYKPPRNLDAGCFD